ncbi:MAG: hypothetical protein BWX68_01089 [Verrucomicrobia bacterium ADurb.Bin063]|nr:MAG: hypothetical protein BWX68_01089 [Verrucomicrobia bacterium ADurb.Bin063]
MLGMNIVNQREIIKRMGEAGLLAPERLRELVAAPVFVWPLPEKTRERSAEEMEFIKTVVLEPGTEMPRLLPFPAFRVATQLGFDLWWHRGTRALTCVRYIAPGGKYSAGLKAGAVTLHEYRWKRPESAAEGGNARGERLEGRLAAWVDWKRVDEEAMGRSHREDDKGFRAVFLDPLHDLQSFLFDIEYPGNVVLGVGPAEKPGKSVEWRQARTHYCILRRGDARACRREATGPSEEQTARAAHWRKAHFRRLRSEVFTQKRGQLVAVRHAWVGPREWEGEDGKVYRVVNFEGGRSTEGKATEGV